MRLPRVGLLLLLAKRAAAAAALSVMPAAEGLRDAGKVAYGDPKNNHQHGKYQRRFRFKVELHIV